MNQMHNLTTVELFAGIGGFRVAADRLGIQTVFANDFKADACAVYRANFGNSVLHEGDIKEVLFQIPRHDILTAGFPCQPFSSAGKKQGTRDPRGTLFQIIVEILNDSKPKFFVLENVKRLLTMENGSHFATILSALSELNYRIEWRLLNTKHFGLAQNRERIIICGWRHDDRAEKSRPDSPSLASESELNDELGLLSDVSEQNWISIEHHGSRFPSWGIADKGKFFATDLNNFQGCSRQVLLRDILESKPGDEYDFTEQTKGRLASNDQRNKYVNGVEIVSNQAGGARMGYTIFGAGGLAPTLTASTSRHYERYQIDGRFRRLTPVEYARLQGFPDNHCDAVTAYNKYELYGNAVPPPLAEWVLHRLLETNDSLAYLNAQPEQIPEQLHA